MSSIKNKAKNLISCVVEDFKEDPEACILGISFGLGTSSYILTMVFGISNNLRINKVANVVKTNSTEIAKAKYLAIQQSYAIDAIIDKIGKTDPEWMKGLDADLNALRTTRLDKEMDCFYDFIKKFKL